MRWITRLAHVILFNYYISIRSFIKRKNRASKEEFLVMLLVLIVFGYLGMVIRQKLGLVRMLPIQSADGAVVAEFGIFPKLNMVSLLAFMIEGFLVHLPFYGTCIRRLNDLNFHAMKKIGVLLSSSIPLIGLLSVFYFMLRRPYENENQWGFPAKTYAQALAGSSTAKSYPDTAINCG